MPLAVSGSIAILFYLCGSWLQLRRSTRRPTAADNRLRILVLACGSCAAILHIINLATATFTPLGVDLSLFNMASLLTVTMVVIVLASALGQPVESLLTALYPLAALGVVLVLIGYATAVPRPDMPGGLVAHILLSMLAYGVVCVATAQALFISHLNHQLKHKSNLFTLQTLPPLQTMETLLFRLLWVGLVLLSLAILSGFLFLTDLFAQHVVHHSVFTMAAWVVFAVLLFGHHMRGWRGSTAIICTLAGFTLLMLGYFGSKVVLEVVLQRI